MATVSIANEPSAKTRSYFARILAKFGGSNFTYTERPRAAWALVTGAGSGIGRAVALKLARQNYRLWLVDVNPESLAQVANEARRQGTVVREVRCDLADAQQVDRLCSEVLALPETLDLLVNNAGVAYYGPTLKMQDDQWDRILAVNLHAPARLTRRLVPRLLESSRGQVLNIASILGLVAHRKACAYHVSKFGLVGLGESLRAEFGPQGLVVTTVCPGFVATNLFEHGMVGQAESERRAPPAWLCTTPEKVAEKALLGLARGKRLVVITPLAHVLHYLKRFAPSLIDGVQQLEGLRLRWKRWRNRLRGRQVADRPQNERPFSELPMPGRPATSPASLLPIKVS
jgi:short-subunit dehydrogenase